MENKTIEPVFTLEDAQRIAEAGLSLGKSIESIKRYGYPDMSWDKMLERIRQYRPAFRNILKEIVIEFAKREDPRSTYGLERYL